MSKTTRLIEELYWQSYKERYYIGTRVFEELARDKNGNIIFDNGKEKTVRVHKTVNELQEAIDSGEIDELIVRCANTLHGGDVDAVLLAMARNLDSQTFHMKSRVVSESDKIRFNTIDTYIRGRRQTTAKNATGIPQWAFGPAEIDAIDDIAKLIKVINSINDVVCGSKYNPAYVTRLGEDFQKVAKANREYARKRKAMLEAQKATALPMDIVNKLQQADKAEFTAEEMAMLRKLLIK